MRLRLFALVIVVCALGAPSAAVAATPASGSVSHAAPETKWTGSMMLSTPVFDQAYFALDGTMGTCMSPWCDTYTLDVKDSDDLTVELRTLDGPDICAELVEPDSSMVLICSDTQEPKNKKTIKKAPAGTYTLYVFGEGNPPFMQTYEGTARLGPLPTDAPPAAAAPEPAPAQPAASPPATLSASAKGLSARRANKSRKVGVTVSSSAPVTKFVAVLSRGGRPYARGSLAKLDGSAKLALKLSRKLAKGRYMLSMKAIGADGRAVKGSAKVAVAR